MTTSVVGSPSIASSRPLNVDRKLAARAGALLQLVVVLAAFGAILLAVVPAVTGYHGETVLSGSMQPMLHVGDVAYIKPAPAGSLHVGEVVTFRVPALHNALVTHRITAIAGSGPGAVLTTKGDNNPARDTFTTPATRVIGTYAFTVPKLGKALAWLHDRHSYVRIGALIFLLVVLHERRALLRDFRSRPPSLSSHFDRAATTTRR